MNSKKAVGTAMTALGLISLLCLVAYFLALHDIYHDYASPSVLEAHTTLSSDALPEWTSCPLEWSVIRFAFWPMLLFHILSLIGIVLYWRNPSKGVTGDQEAVTGG